MNITGCKRLSGEAWRGMELQYENIWRWFLTHLGRKCIPPSGRWRSVLVCEIYAEDPHSSSGVPNSEVKHGCLKLSLLPVMKAFLDMKWVPLFPCSCSKIQRNFQNLTIGEKLLSTMQIVWETLPFVTLTRDTERQPHGGKIVQTKPELQPPSRSHAHTRSTDVEPTVPEHVA